MNTYTVTLELIHPTYPTDEEWYFEGTYAECLEKLHKRVEDMQQAHQQGIVRIYEGTNWEVDDCWNEVSVECIMIVKDKKFRSF